MSDRKRTRLSPHDRRMQLLDCAKHIVQEKGLSSLTMEGLAVEAGVSNPLVYKYFDTRLALLQELLVREMTYFYGPVEEQINNATSFDEIAQIVVRANFDEVAKGNILYILRSQADIREVLQDKEKEGSNRIGKLLVEWVIKKYDISRERALHAVVFSAGSSQRAAERYGEYGGDKEQMIEDTVKFIFGGIDAIAKIERGA